MKIGILTLPFNNNYGGYLQSYALMRVLKEMGHQPVLLYRRHNAEIRARKMQYVKDTVWNLLHLHRPHLYRSVEYYHRKVGVNMLSFVSKYIAPRTRPLYNSKALYDEVMRQKLDAVVLGSDQLWRPDYGPGIEDYFLTGVSGSQLKRLSYAASFGSASPKFTEQERENCGKAISEFVGVSVREKSGLEVIKQFDWQTKSEPQVVLDPTMLLTADDYNQVLSKAESKAKSKMFCYILDFTPVIRVSINSTAKALRKEIYEIADIQKGNTILPSIEDWLTAIRDADYVITDSFHGTVFSIIFNKPFAVFANKERGYERFETLLNHFGLEDRIVKADSSISDILERPIYWNDVAASMAVKKRSSVEFLLRSLNA